MISISGIPVTLGFSILDLEQLNFDFITKLQMESLKAIMNKKKQELQGKATIDLG